MKKILFLAILLIASISSYAQPLKWAKAMGGTGGDFSNSIAVDPSGNVYTTGNFYGTTDFDPGPGTFNLTSASGNYDIFISKLDAAGNFVWAKAMGGTSADYGSSIAVDVSGNVFTTGYFFGTADFDTGPGTFNLTSAGGNDIFISKLDAAGNFVWAKAMGGTSNDDYVYSIAVDASGNVFTTGYFNDTADFDTGPGTFNLTTAGSYEIFISKLDATGNFVWAKAMGSTGADVGRSITVDIYGNVYTTGSFKYTVDFDPGPGTFNLTSAGSDDIFISKLDAAGNFVWAKAIGSISYETIQSIAVDAAGNVFTTGGFRSTADFDPGPGTFNLTSAGGDDIFISKLDAAGNFVWAKAMGGSVNDGGNSIAVDSAGNVFTTGAFGGTVDFDPGPGIFNLNGPSFIYKLDAAGNFVWAKGIGGSYKSITVDAAGNVFITGEFYGTVDFDPGPGTFNLTAASADIIIVKLDNITASGNIFNDLNLNCVNDGLENYVGSPFIIIQPGNIVTQTNNGIWSIDSLPAGTFTATVDTSGQWKATCSPSVTFTVVHPDTFVQVTPIGLKNTNPCTEPNISILAQTLRRCFSNQMIYVEAQNFSTASQVIYNSYADVKLDSFLTINSSTRPYTSLGNYTYRFQLDSLYPWQSKSWQISTTVSCAAQLGRTLTLQANLYPVAPCVLDSTPNIISGVAPCLTSYDNSHLIVNGSCIGDSIRFVIKNAGSSMSCFMPTRMFLDNVLQNTDSVKLNGNDSLIMKFLSDGRTWRLETDQHPLHPGNSHPNATVEACGDSALVATNWTPGLVNAMNLDDTDPVVDIFCAQISGSFDPNDKTGYPTGVDFGHYILPNQQMQYVIRFQNTGTDTAFKVVIRDTLETDLNIFSVVSGVSSHNYSFRMYGPRILEWTFNNIMLPDSFHSEPNSHGFVTFTVEQNENLPSGTSIDNSAAIYFDFNSPIITNTSHHEIQRELLTTGVSKNVAKGDVLVYPNPNNGLFKVELPFSMPSTPLRQQKITICNVMGQVIYISTTLNEQSIEIDLSKQPNGIYFLKVENGEMEWNKKVVKN